MLGQTVSHYRILEKIGQGAMGEVYLAEDTQLDRRVALKFLLPEKGDDRLYHRRFLQEAKAAASLDHPYICHVHEIGEDLGRVFIAMEYLEGETLRQRLQRGPLPLRDALRLGAEIAEAVEKAHSRNIVHRDLKPENILVTAEGHAKVMDFGLAQLRNPLDAGDPATSPTDLTAEGTVPGTPAYMSPEQIRSQELDGRSDIFGLGLVLYEMLTGSHPFRKTGALATAAAIVNETHPPLSERVDLLPPGLEPLVDRMLAKQRDDRPASMAEIQMLLQSISASTDTAAHFPLRTGRRGRRLAALGLALVVLILAGVGLWRLLQSDPVARPVDETPRLAVLPFENLSRQQEDEAFSDGLTESLITRLAKLRGLQVISRTSIMRFKQTQLSVPEIAAQLGVGYVLQGSLLKSGEECRVTAQLIKVADDSHLWAEDYRMPWSDIFTIQDEVSNRVVDRIQVALQPGELEKLRQPSTRNIEAYTAFVKGLHALSRYNYSGQTTFFEAAERSLQAAASLDPSYSEALAQLARLYFIQYETLSGSAWLEKAEGVARESLRRDSANSMASAVLSWIALRKGEFEQARRWSQEALSQAAGNSFAHNALGFTYAALGFYESGISEFDQAIALDPLYLTPYANRAYVLVLAGRPREAARSCQEGLQIQPDFLFALYACGFVHLRGGEWAEAEAMFQQGLSRATGIQRAGMEVGQAIIEAQRGNLEPLQPWLAELEQPQLATTSYSREALLMLAFLYSPDPQSTAHRYGIVGYRHYLSSIQLLKDLRPAQWSRLRQDRSFREAVEAAHREWTRDLSRFSPLPIPPPTLPPPEEVFAQ